MAGGYVEHVPSFVEEMSYIAREDPARRDQLYLEKIHSWIRKNGVVNGVAGGETKFSTELERFLEAYPLWHQMTLHAVNNDDEPLAKDISTIFGFLDPSADVLGVSVNLPFICTSAFTLPIASAVYFIDEGQGRREYTRRDALKYLVGGGIAGGLAMGGVTGSFETFARDRASDQAVELDSLFDRLRPEYHRRF